MKKESMTVKLAALSGIVHELQKVIQNDRELSMGPVSDAKGF
jgi:hypothetical protein